MPLLRHEPVHPILNRCSRNWPKKASKCKKKMYERCRFSTGRTGSCRTGSYEQDNLSKLNPTPFEPCVPPEADLQPLIRHLQRSPLSRNRRIILWPFWHLLTWWRSPRCCKNSTLEALSCTRLLNPKKIHIGVCSLIRIYWCK